MGRSCKPGHCWKRSRRRNSGGVIQSFTKRMNWKKKRLKNAVKSGGATEIDVAIKALTDQWTLALKDLETRKSAFAAQFTKPETLLGWLEQAPLGEKELAELKTAQTVRRK